MSLYGHAFKSFVTLWEEDLDTSLQLKYNIFIFSLSPFLKLSCRTFPLSCVKDFHLQHFSHRMLFYRTSMTIFLMHSLHMYCKWTLCSTENSSNMHWSTLYEMQQISSSSHSALTWWCSTQQTGLASANLYFPTFSVVIKGILWRAVDSADACYPNCKFHDIFWFILLEWYPILNTIFPINLHDKTPKNA